MSFNSKRVIIFTTFLKNDFFLAYKQMQFLFFVWIQWIKSKMYVLL